MSRDDGATWQVQPLPAAMERTAAAVRKAAFNAGPIPGEPTTDPAAMTDAAVFVDERGAIRLAATAPDEPVTYHLGDVRGGGWRTVWTLPPPRVINLYGPVAGGHRLIDAFAFGKDGLLYGERRDADRIEIVVVSPSGIVSTMPRLPAPSPLAGASIAGMSGSWGVRDAHGQRVYVLHGRGPIRTTEEVEYLALHTYLYGRGRWLVGGIVP